MSRWFRHYAGMMRDDKLVRVAIKSQQPIERVVWVWGAILETAAEINAGGRFDFDAEEAAYFLRVDVTACNAIVTALNDIGRISDDVICNWGKRQFKSDDSAVRVRRHRSLKTKDTCNGPEPLRNAPETETETETDSCVEGAPTVSVETDKTVSRETSVAEKSEAVKIIEAFDAERVNTFGREQGRLCPAGDDLVFAQRWVVAGATEKLCRPIFAATAVKRAFDGKEPIGSLKYFDKSIASALAEQSRPMPKGNPNGRSERRPFDPIERLQSDRNAIAGALLGDMDSGMVAGVREGTFSDGPREGNTGATASDRRSAETLPPGEYRVLRCADGPADPVCEDIQPPESGHGDSGEAVSRNAHGPSGRPVGKGDHGDDPGAQEPLRAPAAGRNEGAGRGSIPSETKAPGQTGNGAKSIGQVTDRELIESLPKHLVRGTHVAA